MAFSLGKGKRRYTYDSAGNRKAKTNHLNGITSNYSYDALYELTQVTQGTSTTESYSYDAAGNRLSSSSVPTYGYNTSNELTSNSSGSYSYDANGNTLSDPSGKSYTWDFENRLTQVVVPGTGTVNFKYDPFGRRIYKQSPNFTSIFAYDGDNLLETLNASGTEVASYTQTQRVDETLAELRSNTTDYYQADGLESITSLSNSAAALANTYTYDSFGNLTASTGTLRNYFEYTGREFDSETGLYFNRARYFDPVSGRWLSEDPIRFFGDKDFYRYSLNNPISYSDPSGLQVPAPAPAPIPWGGALTLIYLDAWLAQHDAQEFKKLCAAYGWSWCSPSPQPQPQPTKQCDNDDRCRKVRQQCMEDCWEEVSRQRVLPQDRPGLLRKCVRKCMNDQECYDF